MEYSWLIQTATMISVAVIAYFIKDLKKTIDDRLTKNEIRIEQVEEKLDSLKADLPFVYATREDFIRSMNGMDIKLDKIYDFITKKGMYG